MANQEEFKEGIESYRKRLIDELNLMNSNIDGFVDSRNDVYNLRHLVRSFFASLDKCKLYLGYIETLVENKATSEHAKKLREEHEQSTKI